MRRLKEKHARFFGTGETFLFSFPAARNADGSRYPWVGMNGEQVSHAQELFMAAENTTLIVGGG